MLNSIVFWFESTMVALLIMYLSNFRYMYTTVPGKLSCVDGKMLKTQAAADFSGCLGDRDSSGMGSTACKYTLVAISSVYFLSCLDPSIPQSFVVLGPVVLKPSLCPSYSPVAVAIFNCNALIALVELLHICVPIATQCISTISYTF